MAHTNRGRVILGGLVAGLVINVVEYITNSIVLREAWGARCRRSGNPRRSPAAPSSFSTSRASSWALPPSALGGHSTAANLGNYPLGNGRSHKRTQRARQPIKGDGVPDVPNMTNSSEVPSIGSASAQTHSEISCRG